MKVFAGCFIRVYSVDAKISAWIKGADWHWYRDTLKASQHILISTSCRCAPLRLDYLSDTQLFSCIDFYGSSMCNMNPPLMCLKPAMSGWLRIAPVALIIFVAKWLTFISPLRMWPIIWGGHTHTHIHVLPGLPGGRSPPQSTRTIKQV